MTAVIDGLRIHRGAAGFDRWDDLLALILRAFAPMHGRIDPPSSALLLTPDGLRLKASEERLFLAFGGCRLAGCAFLAERQGYFYLGKLAVEPELQGRGIGKALVAAVERYARRAGKSAIELETRVELVENHATFARLGFIEIGRTAHSGYSRPTSITMRKELAV